MCIYKSKAICGPMPYKKWRLCGKSTTAQPANRANPTRPAKPPGANQTDNPTPPDQPGPTPGQSIKPGPTPRQTRPAPLFAPIFETTRPHISRGKPKQPKQPTNRGRYWGQTDPPQSTQPGQPTTRKRGKRSNPTQPPQNANNPANGVHCEVSAN